MSINPNVLVHPYGPLADGRTAQLYTLRNAGGLVAKITNYGGILTELQVPDRTGQFQDIVLGRASLEGYLAGHPHFGAITGRVAGRISGAKFTINEQSYQLIANNGPNCLHGGLDGFDRRLWQAKTMEIEGSPCLELKLHDPDGSNGFPGNLACTVRYILSDANALTIHYSATCDRSTPLNLTQHSYFNLNGHQAGSMADHAIQLFADHTACAAPDGSLLGKKSAVRLGYNDFRNPTKLAALARHDNGNVDTHYFLPAGRTPNLKRAARIYAPESGRILEAWTTEPGLQFYAGLHLETPPGVHNKDQAQYQALSGFCLETQDYPDSINQPQLGSARLNPGQLFQSTTCYRFMTAQSAPTA